MIRLAKDLLRFALTCGAWLVILVALMVIFEV